MRKGLYVLLFETPIRNLTVAQSFVAIVVFAVLAFALLSLLEFALGQAERRRTNKGG